MQNWLILAQRCLRASQQDSCTATSIACYVYRHGGLTHHRRPILTHIATKFIKNQTVKNLGGSPFNADCGSKLESDSQSEICYQTFFVA
jgi:hypothetical protein